MPILYERLAIESQRHRRLSRLKGTATKRLNPGCIDFLELLEIIRLHCPQPVYDIGVCLGTWSLLAKACLPEASIHTFEPLRVHADKINQLTQKVPDITLHKVALGSKSR